MRVSPNQSNHHLKWPPSAPSSKNTAKSPSPSMTRVTVLSVWYRHTWKRTPSTPSYSNPSSSGMSSPENWTLEGVIPGLTWLPSRMKAISGLSSANATRRIRLLTNLPWIASLPPLAEPLRISRWGLPGLLTGYVSVQPISGDLMPPRPSAISTRL